jgi:hypothetical protein
MIDLKLLDGKVEDVAKGLKGLSLTDLSALLAAEKEHKNRSGVIDAIEAAQQNAADENANIAAVTEFDPSGAPRQVVSDVDSNHPAVDANPRANTTEAQNRIDFNDPSLDGREAVEKNLADQAKD